MMGEKGFGLNGFVHECWVGLRSSIALDLIWAPIGRVVSISPIEQMAAVLALRRVTGF